MAAYFLDTSAVVKRYVRETGTPWVQALAAPTAGHSLARRHALRGYDAVQLAAAIEVHSQAQSLTLLSADADLKSAATAEGLLVDDPNSHP